MSTQFDAIADVLKKAFQVEVDGFTFYSMAAEQATRPAVKKVFERLSRDETEHKAYLRAVMRRYEDQGAKGFFIDRHDPDLAEFSSKIFTEEFREQALNEEFAMGALSIAIQLETNAVRFFGTAAQEASDPQIGGFFRFLADWEDLHLRTLKSLYDSVRTEFWPDQD